MKKRGKILRDPGANPGLLMIEGRQYRFYLEAVWTSEVPPKPGLAVDVQFDRAGQILAITAVPEPPFADKPAERFASTARAAAMTILRKVATKCGMPNLLRR
jgi:predicted molibdopterin-dependent oxidoreductase YjgC